MTITISTAAEKTAVFLCVQKKDSKMKNKLNISMSCLSFEGRDLSPALVILKNYAQKDKHVASNTKFTINQFLFSENTETIFNLLKLHQADVYAFSCYVWNITKTLELCELLKQSKPDCHILLGGPEAGPIGESLLSQNPFVDMIIKGDGEIPFLHLIKHLVCKEKSLDEVPSLCFRKKHEIKTNHESSLQDLSELPSVHMDPEYQKFLRNSHETVTASIETSRGCIFKCRYCAWGNGRRVRFRAMDDVKRDFKFLLKNPKVKKIYVTDADLLLKRRRGKELMRFLNNENFHKKQIIFEMNPELLDEESILLLSSMSNDEFAFGLQSSSSQTLKAMNRKFNVNRYRNNILKLKRINPNAHIYISLIIGLPEDNLDAFRSSLEFALQLMPEALYVHELLCLPGTEFFHEQKKYGIKADNNPPHSLITHNTFPTKDREHAKWLGFHLGILHRMKDAVKNLRTTYHNRAFPGETLLQFLENFIFELNLKTNLLGRKNINEINTIHFEGIYKNILSQDQNRQNILQEIEKFRTQPSKQKYRKILYER
jgi:radical SAM superfamily enzyme YgiQ (UPF0313 family)